MNEVCVHSVGLHVVIHAVSYYLTFNINFPFSSEQKCREVKLFVNTSLSR